MHLANDPARELRRRFNDPSPESRPTPLFWWSGADLDLTRLEWQLDQLSEKGVGGTIVGYSHLADGGLDHGNPEPLTASWWSLFRKFVTASAQRGMSVGMQDYGIIGKILLQAADRTDGLASGSLKNSSEVVRGPAKLSRSVGEGIVVGRRAISADGLRLLDAAKVEGDRVTWILPDGEWILSTILRVPGQIGLSMTTFDPMHPEAGNAVIDLFYSRFLEELGELFGSTFTTFFQDELDLGLITPMWNSLVGDRLEAQGFNVVAAIHLLWHGASESAMSFRAAYRDVVVELLQAHYFRPIFEWHESHSTFLVMDQLSRGDLRLGHVHYADFMETMAWYHGPGNDDPDLTGPRNIAAFRTSASIAHLHGRPRVTNEAFHSSGWGVTPQMVVAGLNVGFAAGANQAILHGLNYTTNAGWWEWASPDFHFRQPWFAHSGPLWTYISRVSEMLRAGEGVSEIGIIDPTPELDFDSSVQSTGVASRLLESLSLRAIDAVLVPQSYLGSAKVSIASGQVTLDVRRARFRAVLVPAMTTMRKSAVEALSAFVDAGGVVIAVGKMPTHTEFGGLNPLERDGWTFVADETSLDRRIRELIDVDVNIEDGSDSLMQSHRRIGELDLFFMVNPGKETVDLACDLRYPRAIERWNAWTGLMELIPSTKILDCRGKSRQRVHMRLQPGESVLLVHTGAPETPLQKVQTEVMEEMDLSSGWRARITPTLDNRYGDFTGGAPSLPIATYHLEVAEQAGGPWRSALVDHGARFLAIGPVDQTAAEQAERDIWAGNESWPDRVRGPWRPYLLSLNTGIPQDPYLLDRDSGPHGLKGVPMEFLDPRALDAEPVAGSYYYFWSTVESPGNTSTIRSQGRAAHTVWLNGEMILDHPEIAAERFPPWALRDMSTSETHTPVELEPGTNAVLVRVKVSSDQPSRVAVVVGGTAPASADKARSIWWQGGDPAAHYQLPGVSSIGWFKAAIPPGARRALIATRAELVSAPGTVISEGEGGYLLSLDSSADWLEFALRPNPGDPGPSDAGALTGPIVWECKVAPVELKSWRELGLHDYSGMVTYERTLEVTHPHPPFTELVLTGIEGSLHVSVNGQPAGVLYTPNASLRIDHLLRMGANSIEIEASNTLVNLFSRLPSPYSSMQNPSGGFSGARTRSTRPNLHRSDELL
jgi:alpha-L-rhamnosidase